MLFDHDRKGQVFTLGATCRHMRRSVAGYSSMFTDAYRANPRILGGRYVSLCKRKICSAIIAERPACDSCGRANGVKSRRIILASRHCAPRHDRVKELTLRQIKVEGAVMITGTIKGSADLLNVSAPGINRSIKHTKDRLSIRLFKRKAGVFAPRPRRSRSVPCWNRCIGRWTT
jgi:hypothetical protein